MNLRGNRTLDLIPEPCTVRLGSLGAGPNRVQKSGPLPGMDSLASFEPTQDDGDASSTPHRTLGTIRIPMRLGRIMATAEFILSENLIIPFILSGLLQPIYRGHLYSEK